MAPRRTAKAATKAQAKRPASPPAAKGNPDALKIADPRYVDPVKRGAMIAANPVVRGAIASRKYSEWIFGKDVDLTEYYSELRSQADAVQQGDMKALESMLVTQANTLDMIFNQMARKAAFCEYLNQMQVSLTLALMAQAQCRATVEALAEIRNPRPLAFVKQANIANGPQQVNNGTAPPASPARTENLEPASELLESGDGERMDARTAGEAGRGDKALEAVGAVNGAAH